MSLTSYKFPKKKKKKKTNFIKLKRFINFENITSQKVGFIHDYKKKKEQQGIRMTK